MKKAQIVALSHRMVLLYICANVESISKVAHGQSIWSRCWIIYFTLKGQGRLGIGGLTGLYQSEHSEAGLLYASHVVCGYSLRGCDTRWSGLLYG